MASLVTKHEDIDISGFVPFPESNTYARDFLGYIYGVNVLSDPWDAHPKITLTRLCHKPTDRLCSESINCDKFVSMGHDMTSILSTVHTLWTPDGENWRTSLLLKDHPGAVCQIISVPYKDYAWSWWWYGDHSELKLHDISNAEHPNVRCTWNVWDAPGLYRHLLFHPVKPIVYFPDNIPTSISGGSSENTRYYHKRSSGKCCSSEWVCFDPGNPQVILKLGKQPSPSFYRQAKLVRDGHLEDKINLDDDHSQDWRIDSTVFLSSTTILICLSNPAEGCVKILHRDTSTKKTLELPISVDFPGVLVGRYIPRQNILRAESVAKTLSNCHVPPEILLKILSRTDGETVSRMQRVSTFWSAVCQDDLMWMTFSLDEWGPHVFALKKARKGTWKQFYAARKHWLNTYALVITQSSCDGEYRFGNVYSVRRLQ